MAARWERFGVSTLPPAKGDGDRYNLRYRTQNDDKVRPEHAALHGVTLPPSDPFWADFYPPNGWNCRCTVVQVRKSKYPATDPDEARRRGNEALGRDTKGMFRFNPGLRGKTVPDYNPYTISKCRNCDLAKGLKTLKCAIVDDKLCGFCSVLHICKSSKGCYYDSEFGERLRINYGAHEADLKDNISVAKKLLKIFPNMQIVINDHVLVKNKPNPEYTFIGNIADRKSIEKLTGITNGFTKAINRQDCTCVVFDLNSNLKEKVNYYIIAKRINWRRSNFEDGSLIECYIVYRDLAVRIGPEHKDINMILNELKKLGRPN